MKIIQVASVVMLLGSLLAGGIGGPAYALPPSSSVSLSVSPSTSSAPTAVRGYDPVAELLLPSASTQTVRAVEADGSNAYLLTREGELLTYDISGLPTTPPVDSSLVSLNDPLSSLTVGLGNGLVRNGDLLYVWGSAGARVVSTASATSPSLGNVFSKASTHNMVLYEDLLIGVGRGHVTVYSLDDPSAPQVTISRELGEDNTGFSAAVVQGALVVGQYASGGQGTTGMVIFDFPTSDTLTYVTTYQTSYVPFHLRSFGTMLAACATRSVYLYDFTSPEAPSLETSYETSARVCARDGDNLVTNGDVLRPVDNQLLFVDSFAAEYLQRDGFPYGSDVEGAHVFLAQSPRVLILLKPQPLASDSAPQGLRVDGHIGLGEWTLEDRIDFTHGFLAAQNDATHLYLLIDMTGDGTPDATDGLNISFDVDGDGQVTPGVDVNYHLLPQTRNLRYRFYDAQGFQPDEDIYRSSRALDFGCSLVDGSLVFDTQGPICDQHVVWELAIDLSEIGAQPGATVRMGFGVTSGSPEFFDAVPANYLSDFSDLFEVDLSDVDLILPPADDRPAMSFDGHPLEVTQAVQTRDNSLPLVAGKDTAARVYLDNNDGSPTLMAVYLYGDQGGVDLPGSPLVNYLTIPTTVDREELRDTANFSLPSSWIGAGSVAFHARAKRWLGAETSTVSTTLDFETQERPLYWVIPVNRGSAASPTLPDAGDVDDHMSFLEEVYPVADVQFEQKPWTALGPNMPLDDALKSELNDYYSNVVLAWIFGLLITGERPFDLPDMVYGFVPDAEGSSDPLWWNNGSGYVAYGGDFDDQLPQEDDYTMAHEINHNLDRSTDGTWGRHNGGCGSGGPDPNWPYTNDDVNEIGFDLRLPWINGVVDDRRTIITADYPDFMSYCQDENLPGAWVSPYRWNHLFDNFASALTTADEGLVNQEGLSAEVQEVLYLSGRLGSEGGGELDPIVVQQGIISPDPAGTEYSIEIRDASDTLLDSLSFDVVFESVEGDPLENVHFSFRVPNPTGVASIQLKQGTTLLDEIVVSDNPPQVTITEPSEGDVWETTGSVRWQASDQDGDALVFDLLYSPDGGSIWYPVASGIQGNEYEVDLDLLPGGSGGKIRIVASDGYNTTTTDSSGTFDVSNRAPSVHIITPRDGARFEEETSIKLKGSAQDLESGAVLDEHYAWSVDGSPAATGSEASVILPPGFHTVTLTARDGDGNSASDSRTIVVGDATRIYLPLVIKAE